jgi:hypothetical protein
VISVYDAAGDVIKTHEHKGDFKEWRRTRFSPDGNFTDCCRPFAAQSRIFLDVSADESIDNPRFP